MGVKEKNIKTTELFRVWGLGFKGCQKGPSTQGALKGVEGIHEKYKVF